MPQRPKNFKIARVDVHPDTRVAKVRTGPTTNAPGRFTADIQLAVPEIRLALYVKVTEGGLPFVQGLTVWASAQTPLTSGTLRRILLDPIVRAAMAEASQPVTDRSDVAPGAFHAEGEPEDQLWVSTPPGATERVRQIARLYNEALTAGSRSPSQDAADAVHISRGQAARYIRKARELGLIPPVGEVVAGPRAAEPDEWPVHVDPVANPQERHRGPDIYRDPEGPRPWETAKEDHAGDQDD